MHTWLLFEDEAREAAWNMALDEALLSDSIDRGKSLLRIYGWSRPSVSIGYFQKFPSELAAQNIDVVRRPTGGGLVDHRGDVTYTVVLPPMHPIARECPQESYNILHRCVVAALSSVGIHASLAPNQKPGSPRPHAAACMTNPTRFDVMFEGRKIAGAAQRRTKSGLLHQGSIWMGDDGKARAEIMHALPRGFREVLGCQFVGYGVDRSVMMEAERLVSERYGKKEWNESRRVLGAVGNKM